MLVSVWLEPSARALRLLSGAVEVSDSRTMQQDVDFGLRGLSSAINDPQHGGPGDAAHRQHPAQVLTTDPPDPAVFDDAGRVLVRPWDLSNEGYIAHGFDQLRHAAPPQPQVVAVLLRVLRMLIAHVTSVGRPSACRRCGGRSGSSWTP